MFLDTMGQIDYGYTRQDSMGQLKFVTKTCHIVLTSYINYQLLPVL